MKKQSPNRASFRVLASGSGWIAVDKPAGVSVHNSPGRDLCALVAHRLQADAGLRKTTGLSGRNRLSAVHRLDRETSGVILLSGSRSVLSHFAAQFEARTVHKRYVALLHGHLPDNDPPDPWHLWKWSLTKTPGGRKEPRGKGSRKRCATRVRAIDRSDHYTLVKCKLHTGRKHQIRRHAKLAGHPVVGDRRYGSRRALDFLQREHNFKRLGLHATHLEIRLPDGSPAVFRSETLPDEMKRLFAEDGQTPDFNAVAKHLGYP